MAAHMLISYLIKGHMNFCLFAVGFLMQVRLASGTF